MPPVPNVILARPGRVQPWPISDACWSPAMPGDGRRAGQGRRLADDAGRVDDRGQHRRRDAQGVEDRRRPSPSRRTCIRPVTPALDGSVTCSVAARQRPRHPGVDGAEAQVAGAVGVGDVEEERQLGGRGCSGDRRMPWACSTRHMPTVRWSCQPMPGPDGLAGGAGPTRSSTPAGWRCRRPRPGRRRPAPPWPRRGRRAASAAASNSTKPGAGDDGSTSRWCDVGDGGVGADDRGPHAAGADVDDEDAHAGLSRAGARGQVARRACRRRRPSGALKTQRDGVGDLLAQGQADGDDADDQDAT